MMKLYGDGIHDDTQAIQQLIDNGGCEVMLPKPENFYLISKPLELPSNFKLVLPRFAKIKLAAGSNCVMVKNKTRDIENPEFKNEFWGYLDLYAHDYPCENIELCGGIWDCNNLEQKPNPLWDEVYEDGYSGFGMLFFNVKNLTLRSLTVKDPINFAIVFDTVTYFTVEDIYFDFNYGNPGAVNMDGIHVNGNCHYGVINHIKGACYDDEIALNSDEGTGGPITNVRISNIYAHDSHSAVRLLANKGRIENVHISDIYGTYYMYCVGITKHYPGEPTGYFAGIVIENIYASKAPRHSIYQRDGMYVFPYIYMEENVKIKDLLIANIHRNECVTPVETIYIGENVVADKITISNVTVENNTGSPMEFLVNKGKVKELKQL